MQESSAEWAVKEKELRGERKEKKKEEKELLKLFSPGRTYKKLKEKNKKRKQKIVQ